MPSLTLLTDFYEFHISDKREKVYANCYPIRSTISGVSGGWRGGGKPFQKLRYAKF